MTQQTCADSDIIRLEDAEGRAWASLTEAAPRSLLQALKIETGRLGPAWLNIWGALDMHQFNRVHGIGLPGDEDGGCIDAALSRFDAAGVRNVFVQIPPLAGAARRIARAEHLGLLRHPRTWVKFHRDASPMAARADAPTVVKVGRERADDFARVVLAGFGMPLQLAPWFSSLPDAPGWSCYVAEGVGEPLGAATMYIDGQSAWFGVAATLPASRRKGAQGALLARRIQDAGQAGATLLHIETGKPNPGEDGPSFANILRAGFEIAYERPNWSWPVDGGPRPGP